MKWASLAISKTYHRGKNIFLLTGNESWMINWNEKLTLQRGRQVEQDDRGVADTITLPSAAAASA